MPGEIDREERLLQRERCGVPGVRVQARAVQQRHARGFASEAEGTQGASVGERKGETFYPGKGDAERFGLCGKIAELAVVDRHLHILLPPPDMPEMPDQYGKWMLSHGSQYVHC